MKKILIFSLFGLLFTACMDLDIPPKNIVADEALLSNPAGLEIYMNEMYSRMPFEEFKYLAEWGFEGNSWLGSTGIEGTGEALDRNGTCRLFSSERSPYWNAYKDGNPVKGAQPFVLLREANHMIESLPKYQDGFAELAYNDFLGQAYFVRAFVFYTMAKRFGGIPLVTKVIKYPDDGSGLEIPRASEEETWDQILADFDKAIELLMPVSQKRGYANKYVALAWKAEAMLYAGSVAKYNEEIPGGRLTGVGAKTQVRVIGFDEDKWEAASKRYFLEAYKAARQVITDGKYSLYKKKWSATDKEAQFRNMVEMFSDLSSPETIYMMEYEYPTKTHGYDAYSGPYIFRNPLSAGTCPPLDFIELFEGFDLNTDGTLKVLDNDGKYLMYDKTMDLFKNAEPRLRAYVIFPGDVFKGKAIELRAGTYTGTTPIAPFFSDYSASADTKYDQLPIATGAGKTLHLAGKVEANKLTGNQVPYNGGTMSPAGENGPFYEDGESNLTGFYGRKWLNEDTSFAPGEGKSAQPFILMRYADVLLAAAEAAVELAIAGEPSPDGSDLLSVATEAVNEIRERAGATKLAVNLTADKASRNIVRTERRKELAFEHKTKWDLRRWRIQHEEALGEFWGIEKAKTIMSNGTSYRFRGLYPFFSTETGKYFFDARFQWVSTKTFNYNTLNYYFEIPGGEVSKSAVIDQQPNR